MHGRGSLHVMQCNHAARVPTAGRPASLQAGAFKIGDAAGTLENIVACKLYRPGSVGGSRMGRWAAAVGFASSGGGGGGRWTCERLLGSQLPAAALPHMPLLQTNAFAIPACHPNLPAGGLCEQERRHEQRALQRDCARGRRHLRGWVAQVMSG